MKTARSPEPAFLFDLDGTLIDTVYEHVLAWSAALESVNIHAPKWKLHRRIGMSGRSLVSQVMREHHSRHRTVNVPLLEKRHDAQFKKLAVPVRTLLGADGLLDFLTRRKIKWAIATTGGRKQTTQLLQKSRLKIKTPVITGDDVAEAKPSPDLFVLAADRLERSVEDCIIVGDSIWDMLAAGRKRALAVGILGGGYGKSELEEAGAFRVYSDPADMLSHIEDFGITPG